jgi:hypothetical protein
MQLGKELLGTLTNADLIVNLIQKSGELSPFKFTAATDFVYIWFINNEI